jgi:hypothetical protein
VELAKEKIYALQRFIKRVVEREIFTPIVRQIGYDPEEVKVRLNWGTSVKPEIEVNNLIRAAELNLISRDEFRAVMKKMGLPL